jgi:flagellar hook protein FlgE
MGFLRSLSAGVTGLRNNTTMMDIIGNNVANINTTGFKSSRVLFGDLFSQTLRGATGATDTNGGIDPMQIGLGSSVETISRNFSQGSIESTGNSSDLAIQGTGFFVVNSAGKNLYTRVGSFQRDANGNLVMSGIGAIVQGTLANAQGVIPPGATLQNMSIDVNRTSAPKATDSVSMSGNVDASAAEYVAASAGPPPVAESGGKAMSTLTVFDSLGNKHSLGVTMTKDAGSNAWDYSVTDENNNVLGSGTLTFNPDGSVATGTPAVIPTFDFSNGANSLDITIDFNNVTQDEGAATLTPQNINGYGIGTMSGWSVDQNGFITANFTNGQLLKLGQVMLAEFNNPSGLANTGNGLYDMSPNSGIASISAPGGGSRSQIVPNSLEQSNVDLSQEFTQMIIAQRGFQANAKVITTSDDILNDLVNLKR